MCPSKIDSGNISAKPVDYTPIGVKFITNLQLFTLANSSALSYAALEKVPPNSGPILVISIFAISKYIYINNNGSVPQEFDQVIVLAYLHIPQYRDTLSRLQIQYNVTIVLLPAISIQSSHYISSTF